MSVGESITRVDAVQKVTGQAKYTADLAPKNVLYAKLVHATIANGRVLSIDGGEAEKVNGFVKLVTCFDVPKTQFPTPGHPWSVEKAHQDVSDRTLLSERVRLYGDNIAVVIAQSSLAAAKAARLVKAEYEEYAPLMSAKEALAHTEHPLHEEKPDNLIAHSHFTVGEESYEQAKAEEPDCLELVKNYQTQTVQHCHLEPAQSYAYMEGDRIVVVSSTQIPHIIRRIIGQALSLPLGRIRVVKPYIGGGFGNKQDALVEPLAAYLTTVVGGKPVMVELSREENFTATRVRHAIEFDTRALVRRDGTLIARKLSAYSAQGGYASHGHSIVANSTAAFKQLYRDRKALECDAYTAYTTMPTAGAMRGYGIPQSDFATECMSDDLALMLHMDPIDFRLKNCVQAGYKDPHTGITFYSYGLEECIQKGKKAFHWEEKRKEYAHQTGDIRRGVGMAIFIYKTGVYPISLETAGARLTLNQDGSVMLQMGATEIGQGADTVFSQMTAETVGITEDRVHIVSTQDTDYSPFDTGAYASRQTYVSGMALKGAAELLKKRILDYAAEVLNRPAEELDIRQNNIVQAKDGDVLLALAKLAEEAQYSLKHSVHISAEYSHHCTDNTFSSGACFAEVEVDIPMCRVKILRILAVHDSGTLINPKLAEAQVHGGVSMGIGYGLYEEMLFNEKGKPLNDNLLDYKLPTAMDSPDMEVEFVQVEDPTGPYGNKALGEPPAIPPAPAIRNAVLNATGVAVDSLPLSPQKLFEHFVRAGLIKEEQGNV
ncbi:MAG: xanthine dehydrogenase molybdenum-binding subunit XdhA [Eubacteriales bacterium]|nr:xanthine dehydrogenase molybdenum-binding subunit XdhA [Eubacteriales bacterium]